jgi:hypothetical protein
MARLIPLFIVALMGCRGAGADTVAIELTLDAHTETTAREAFRWTTARLKGSVRLLRLAVPERIAVLA